MAELVLTMANLLQNLQQKADERNPDEFYFAMERSQTRGGVHKARCDLWQIMQIVALCGYVNLDHIS